MFNGNNGIINWVYKVGIIIDNTVTELNIIEKIKTIILIETKRTIV